MDLALIFKARSGEGTTSVNYVYIASETKAIHEVDDLLTLKGLKIIYLRNVPRKK